ncbi:MAG: hypothetical protein WAN66_15930 [Limnoraphis robusta]|uniref:Isopropylmalate/homocitrate/citramalate synthase n=2 Tax=Limnoraphis robusta TaxID=1118279 RepID=A0A0J9HMA9_9CYAN|nr:hypothetical protein [Limnoraphis robusta]KMW70344.1 hypothetical protein WN50_36045 [Limnoraphis robusta CS-951]MEA5500592.1 hypothetical protein [Limnoraphis robusta BA-68 BA1]MEA5522761.1 hypothetical protein [Limnoraphis robusta CCNP1315]MEA5541400.1 hypothetical protein [Limnoraphis robusta Tam1]MEA5543777.1 hypothetical protein [Limnoraphis robusta CCNP1324]
MELNDFLYPGYKYRGKATIENIAFDAKLQQFAQRINIIAGLHTGGKLSSQESYDRIKSSWKEVEVARQELGINKSR